MTQELIFRGVNRHARVAAIALCYLSTAGTDECRCEATSIKEHKNLSILVNGLVNCSNHWFAKTIIGLVSGQVYETQ